MPVLDKSDAVAVAKFSEFVASHPHTSLMQSPSWAKVKQNWNSDYVYLEDENGEIRASLSILSISNDGEHAFMYAPRGPVCEPGDIGTVKKLITEAEPIVNARNAFLLRMDPEVPYSPELIPEYGKLPNSVIRSRDVENPHSFSNPRLNMILEFNGRTYDEIVASYKRKFRYQIRRTVTDGLSTQIIRPRDQDSIEKPLKIFYTLTEEMADRHSISHRPIEYFENLLAAFPDSYLLLTEDNTGDVLSAAIAVPFGKKVSYLYAASANRKAKLQPSVQMIMEAIKLSIAEGREEFDFGGVFELDLEDGLYRYKSKYCGMDGYRELLGEIDIVYDKDLYEDFLNKQNS